LARATRRQVEHVAHPAAGAGRDGDFLADVVAGLRRRPRSLPSRWFYDARGSRLFQWITKLPEYTLTRAETEILERHGAAIARPLAGRPCTVLDLGAGDGHKTRLLLAQLAGRSPEVTYAPVDVSPAALDEAVRRVRAALPGVRTAPLRATWTEALRRLACDGRGAKLVLFLGSSIGNLEPAEARAFLRALRAALRPGDHLLVGFDLLKPLPAIRQAYDDPQGITRAFNLNLLARANRELGADFDLSSFRHSATWDPARPAMESWLVSLRSQVVHVGGHAVRLEAGEKIHTEISCKFTVSQIAGLARDAGFAGAGLFLDARRWFADALWRAPEAA
jgi:dimethylhistidine N-methyltransferase